MGAVVNWPHATRLDLPPQKIIDALPPGAEFDGIVIFGTKTDGSEYFASSYADGGDVLWLMERAKLLMLRMADES